MRFVKGSPSAVRKNRAPGPQPDLDSGPSIRASFQRQFMEYKGRPNSTSPRPALTPRASTARSGASSNAPADQPKRARGDQSEAGHDGGDTRIRDRATVRRHASGLSARYTSKRGYFE
jgi:hypothetical protein